MTHKFFSKCFALLLSGMLCSTPLMANAAYGQNVFFEHHAFLDDTTITAEAFTYSVDHAAHTFVFETNVAELADSRPYMLAGFIYDDNGEIFDYLLSPLFSDSLSNHAFTTTFRSAAQLKTLFGAQVDFDALQVGDILKIEHTAIMDSFPPMIADPRNVTFLGHGEELLGTEFRKVIRHEFCTYDPHVFEGNPITSTFDFVTGDITEDDEVDIMDAIALNKYLLGSHYLSCYQALTADVDKNTVIDSTDSLMILKEVVGITKDFVET